MKYKLLEKANPRKRTEKKWYANAVSQGKVGQREITGNIANFSHNDFRIYSNHFCMDDY